MIKSKLSILIGRDRITIKEVSEITGINRGSISKLYHDKLTRIDMIL
jgi:putative transcriptional regulator